MKLKYPIDYIAITEYFKKGLHNGITLAGSNSSNQNEVYSPADGIVEGIRNNYSAVSPLPTSYGNYIKIKHSDEITSICAHLKTGSIPLKVGDEVKQGELIGIMDSEENKNQYLYYEVLNNNSKVNPIKYTYVFPDQTVSLLENEKNNLLYYKKIEETESKDDITSLSKQNQELQDKIILQSKEIDSLKKSLNEIEDYKFKYEVKKTSRYEIKLNEGETLLIK